MYVVPSLLLAYFVIPNSPSIFLYKYNTDYISAWNLKGSSKI